MKEKIILEDILLDVIKNTHPEYFGEKIGFFVSQFNAENKIHNYFDDEVIEKIKNSKDACELDVTTLSLLEILFAHYINIFSPWPESWQFGYIKSISNVVISALAEKQKLYEMDLDSIDLDKPAVYIDSYNYVDVSDNCVFNYSPWPDDADTDALGVSVVEKLINNKQIEGKSYVQVMSTEYNVSTYDFNHEIENDIDFDLIPINTPELEKLKEYYMSKISIKDITKYDNIICIVEDDPNYSNSNKKYNTNTIIVSSKDKSYIINIGFTKEKYYNMSSDEECEFVKKIEKRQFR